MPDQIDPSIYNRLNTGQQAGFGQMSPAQLIDLANRGQELQSRQGMANALRNNLDPTAPSGVNVPGAIREYLSNPNNRATPADIEALQGAERSGLVKQQTGSDLDKAQDQELMNLQGTLSTMPGLDFPTYRNYVMSHAVRHPWIPDYKYRSLLDNAPRDSAGLQKYTIAGGNIARGPENVMRGTEVLGPGNRPTVKPEGTLTYERAGVGQTAPGVPTALSPSEQQATGKVGAASAEASIDLRKANDTSMTRKAMLGNMEQELDQFASGPGADWSRLSRAWVNRNVPLPSGWQFDPKSVASQEEFNKQAYMLAASQFQAIGGTGTDEKFGAAFHMNPNETMSSLGNKGVMRMLKGNEDAIQAKNRAWRGWLKTHSSDTYDDFSAQFNDHFDPRAFQFKYLPEKERQAYINKMDPDERERFLGDLTYAHQQGWIRFEGKK